MRLLRAFIAFAKTPELRSSIVDSIGGILRAIAFGAVALFAIYLLGVMAEKIFWSERPYFLTRDAAAHAIESTAQFQHKTKLRFEVGEFEGVIPGVCHNFEVSPDKIALVESYLKSGVMQLSKYGSQLAPFHTASPATYDLSLSSEGRPLLLVDRIDQCRPRDVTERTGVYELTLGEPEVEVNGIRKDGNRAFVDFIWHFKSLSRVGLNITRVQLTKDVESRDDRASAAMKAIAPFWNGWAELVRYDDGWRVVTIRLNGFSFPLGRDWEYGPEWPDPNFNWHTFDEDENHY